MTERPGKQERASAQRLEERGSAQRTEEQGSPQRSEERGSAQRLEERESAVRTEEQGSVQRLEERGSAQRLEERESVMRTEEQGSAQRLEERESVMRTEEQGSPQRSEERESAVRTEEQGSAHARLSENRGSSLRPGDSADAEPFDVRAEQLRAALGSDRRRGLRLLAPDDSPEQLGRRLRADAALKALIGEAEAEARRMLGKPEPELTESLFLIYEKTGERLPFERAYFERRKRLSAFAIMALARPEEEEYRDKLLQTARAVCDEHTWCLPAHYDERRGPLGSIDLFAAETGFALAELSALLGERLPSDLVERIAAEAERRLFRPFLEQGPYGWERLENNWSAVCAGSIGGAALYLIEDEERLSALLERVCRAMECFLAGYGADGACVEGYLYWQYGFGYYVYFASLLKEATNGRLDGFASAKVREIALFQQRCFSGGDAVVNFSDSLPRSGIFMGLTRRLHDEYPQVALPAAALRAPYAADHCGRWAPAIRNLVWAAGRGENAVEGGYGAAKPGSDGGDLAAASARDPAHGKVGLDRDPEPAGSETAAQQEQGARHTERAWPTEAHYMADAEWLMSRHVAESGSTFCFAAKGGHNDEPHNHNDCGHFILHADGEAYLADLGSGMYTKSYFGPERYSFWCNGSHGHSVPLIGGARQRQGAECRAKVAEVSLEPDEDRLCLDIREAYPEAAGLTRLERRFRWIKGDLPTLELHDRYEFAQAGMAETAPTERFITLLEPKPDPTVGLVSLEGARKLFILYDAASWTPEVTPRSDMDHFGKERHWYTLDFHKLWEAPDGRADEEAGGKYIVEAAFYFHFA